MELPLRRLSDVLEDAGWYVGWYWSDNPDGHTDDPAFVRAIQGSTHYDFIVTANRGVVDFIPDRESRLVLVNHGPVPSKNHRPVSCVNTIVCTPYAGRLYRGLGQSARHWVEAGYVEFDTVRRPALGGKTLRVVYAPTFHHSFCGDVSIQLHIMQELSKLDGQPVPESPDVVYAVYYCPHPITLHSHPVWEFAEKHLQNSPECGMVNHIVNSGPDDIPTPIVVTDYSAAIPLAMPWAKVVTYNSFTWWDDPRIFSGEDRSWEMHDACYQFSNPAELLSIVHRVSGSDPLAERRAEWTGIIYGHTLHASVAEKVRASLETQLLTLMGANRDLSSLQQRSSLGPLSIPHDDRYTRLT